MKIRSFLFYLLACVMIYFFSGIANAGSPLWTFTALTPTTISVQANGTASIQYKITNQSSKFHTLQMQPIPGISQITTGSGICGSTFTLAGKASCVLSLQANGSQITTPISDGPIVCQQGSATQCYRPSSADVLHITSVPATGSATLSVSGSPLILTVNGPSGFLTITNTSVDVTATGITSDFTGTALVGKVTETGNTCNSVAPGASCMLTFSPGSDVMPQTPFPIQGTNTNTITAAIGINPTISPISGPTTGNTFVIFTGGNLAGASSVLFGTTSAGNVIQFSSSSIGVHTPASTTAGFVDVIITASVGSLTLPNAYEYIAALLPPTINSNGINPPAGTAAGGQTVTITGTNFVIGSTTVTFGGDSGTSVVVAPDGNTLTVITPAHSAGAVNVVVTTPYGNIGVVNGYTYS